MADEYSPPPPEATSPPETPKLDLGGPLPALVRQLFFVADEAGDPVLSLAGPNVVVMLYPDGSTFRVTFEHRRGELESIGTLPIDDEDRKRRNQAFADGRKLQDERRANFEQAKRAQQEQKV
jgi:hypothetical protein